MQLVPNVDSRTNGDSNKNYVAGRDMQLQIMTKYKKQVKNLALRQKNMQILLCTSLAVLIALLIILVAMMQQIRFLTHKFETIYNLMQFN